MGEVLNLEEEEEEEVQPTEKPLPVTTLTFSEVRKQKIPKKVKGKYTLGAIM